MANARIGSHPSHGFAVVEQITEAKQLTWGDSGKLFFCDQNAATYAISLPSLSLEIAGWHAKFIFRGDNGGQIIKIQEHSDKSPSIIALEVGQDSYNESTAATAINFPAAASSVGCTIEVHGDGTYWYGMATGGVADDDFTISS